MVLPLLPRPRWSRHPLSPLQHQLRSLGPGTARRGLAPTPHSPGPTLTCGKGLYRRDGRSACCRGASEREQTPGDAVFPRCGVPSAPFTLGCTEEVFRPLPPRRHALIVRVGACGVQTPVFPSESWPNPNPNPNPNPIDHRPNPAGGAQHHAKGFCPRSPFAQPRP